LRTYRTADSDARRDAMPGGRAFVPAPR
jgi:hypothetical protein